MLVSSTLGFVAATLSPLAMTIGFIIWGKSWQATPFALNLFKCTLAGFLFMVISLCIRSSSNASLQEQSMVIVSSIIGIVIGDNTWLLALKIIGAKRVIVIDALKPFCAAFAGYFLLHEPLTVPICVGLVVSSVGVVLVATEKESLTDEQPLVQDTEPNTGNHTAPNSTNSTRAERAVTPNLFFGSVLAAINVILDAFGSVLTKQFGHSMNTWEINYLRFGFAAIFMTLISMGMGIIDYYSSRLELLARDTGKLSESMHSLNGSIDSSGLEELDENPMHVLPHNDGVTTHSSTIGDVEMSVLNMSVGGSTEDREASKETEHVETWYAFPIVDKMSSYQWASVSMGVLFVTFLCPAMSNYALFKLPLSLCLTINSLGPIYSIPLVFVMLGERSCVQAIVGSVLAVGGIVIMCI